MKRALGAFLAALFFSGHVFAQVPGVTTPSAPRISYSLGEFLPISSSPIVLADGLGVFIPNMTSVSPGIGVKPGFTNSTDWILVTSIIQNGSDFTNPQSLFDIAVTDPSTLAECSVGNSKGVFTDADDSQGAGGGSVWNFNGVLGAATGGTGQGCLQFPGSGVGSRNFPAVPTIFIWSVATGTSNWAVYRNDVDIGLHGTGAINKTTFTAGTVTDWNADCITAASPCTAGSLYLGNMGSTNSLQTPGAGSMGFFMLIENRALVCTAADATLGTKTVTGWGTGTCSSGGVTHLADVIPPEFIAKVVEHASGYLKEPGSGCTNFDSDGTATVICMRMRNGALLTNEGTATNPFAARWASHSGFTDPGGYGPFQACVGPGGPPASGIYCYGIAQGCPNSFTGCSKQTAATSGTITQTFGSQPITAGQAIVLDVVVRATAGAFDPTGVTFTCPSAAPNLLQAVPDGPGSSHGSEAGAICYGFAAGGETSLTVSFSGALNTVSQMNAAFHVYNGVTGFETVSQGGNCKTVRTATTSLSSVAGITTSHPNVVAHTAFFRESANTNFVSGSQRVRHHGITASGPLIVSSDSLTASSGGVIPTETATGVSDDYSVCTLPMY